MPNHTVKTSVSIDADIIEAARERSRQFDRFGETNVSAYISALIKADLEKDKPEVIEGRGGSLTVKSEGLKLAERKLAKALKKSADKPAG